MVGAPLQKDCSSQQGVNCARQKYALRKRPAIRKLEGAAVLPCQCAPRFSSVTLFSSDVY